MKQLIQVMYAGNITYKLATVLGKWPYVIDGTTFQMRLVRGPVDWGVIYSVVDAASGARVMRIQVKNPRVNRVQAYDAFEARFKEYLTQYGEVEIARRIREAPPIPKELL